MAIKFPTNKFARYNSATFFDNQPKLSIFLRVRFDTVNAGTKQYVFEHKNATNQVSLRRDSATGNFKATLTAGTASFVSKESTANPTAATVYDLAIVWQKETAAPNGFRLWVDGTEQGTGVSTTGGTGNYDSLGGSLVLGARNGSSPTEFGICTIEKFLWFNDFLLTPTLITALRSGKWHHKIQGLPRPAVAYMLLDGELAAFRDDSGNNRHVTDIGGPLLAGGYLGKVDVPHQPQGMAPLFGLGGSSGGSPANPWVLVTPPGQEILHPSAAYSDVGLTNGTEYDYYVESVDAGGNVSVPSATVSVIPAVPAIPISSLQVPWQRAKRFSRFRSAQQG